MGPFPAFSSSARASDEWDMYSRCFVTSSSRASHEGFDGVSLIGVVIGGLRTAAGAAVIIGGGVGSTTGWGACLPRPKDDFLPRAENLEPFLAVSVVLSSFLPPPIPILNPGIESDGLGSDIGELGKDDSEIEGLGNEGSEKPLPRPR